MLSALAQRHLLTAFVLYNNLFTVAGCIYGWISFTEILLDENVFAGLCTPDSKKDDNSNYKCHDQQERYDLIFTVAVNAATVGTAIFGLTLEKFGPRLNAFIGSSLMCVGVWLLALADATTTYSLPGDPFLFGYALIAFGGIGVYITHMQFGNLYEDFYLFNVIANSLFNVTALLFLVFSAIHSDGVSRSAIFQVWGCMIIFSVIGIWLLYPRTAYKPGAKPALPIMEYIYSSGYQLQQDSLNDNNNNDNNNDNNNHHEHASHPHHHPHEPHYHHQPHDDSIPSSSSSSSSHKPLKQSLLSDDERSINGVSDHVAIKLQHQNNDNDDNQLAGEDSDIMIQEEIKNNRTLIQELQDPAILILTFYFSFGLLFLNYYNATITDQLDDMNAPSNFNKAFLFMIALMPICLSKGVDYVQARFGYAGATLIATSAGLISYTMLFIPVWGVQIIGFFAGGVQRALHFNIFFPFIATQYRQDHYGYLVGIITLICAGIGFLQQLMTQLNLNQFNKHFWIMNTAVIIMWAPFLLFSVFLYRKKL